MKNETGHKRIVIITGHYGSGKTEFAVNLALRLREQYPRVALADIDIVNPYFRSREREELFRRRGIQLIASAQKYGNADVPALPPNVISIFEDDGLSGVLDVGGDPVGARVLARYAPYLKDRDYEMLVVLNFNRGLTKTPDEAAAYLQGIERSAGIRATGLVCNTHLCGETTVQDVMRGNELSLKVAEKTGIPLVYNTVDKRLCGGLPPELGKTVFPLTIYMNKPWEQVNFN